MLEEITQLQIFCDGVFSDIRRPTFSPPVRAILENVSNAAALVACLCPSVRTILQNVTNLIAIVAGGLFAILNTVPCYVCCASTSVASVQLRTIVTLSPEMPILFALVTLEAPSEAVLSVPGIRPVQPLHPAFLPVPSPAAPDLHLSLISLALRTFSSKVACLVAPVAD